MASLNRVVLVGNLTRDPEVKNTPGGTVVCEFSVAVNSREKVDGEWADRADFFDVTVFGNQAEACGTYLAKGKPVAVDGRLRQERWEKDGQKRSRIKVVGQTVQFLGSRDSDGGAEPDWRDAVPADKPPEDDIPF